MPTLHWIGKDKVVSHHQDILCRVLEHQYSFIADPLTGAGQEQPEPTHSGNKIIHGDNLEALKSLLPEYEGKIKCIYIDPPYNTGNENWVYNDKVNHPKIKKWLGEVVGKDGEDLSRHDKWLCMMYPRLKLLNKLLADDGAIFISIDDNEQANLKLIVNEIFSEANFIGNICWRRRKSQANLSKNISPIHDFILIYGKKESELNKVMPNLNKDAYKNPDNDARGLYVTMPCTNKGGAKYSITTPTGKIIEDEWRFKRETYDNLFRDNRIVFPNKGNGKPRYKLFLKDKLENGVIPNTWWDDEGSNQDASNELKLIFNSKNFDTPKPIQLIEKILQAGSNMNSTILDSFAGSGTTAHAVLNLNKKDGGNRKFILVEMEDYANDITAERVKRVSKGYGLGTKAVEGTGGAFDYYELGLPILNENNNLNEEVGLSIIREYIWFSETRSSPSYNLGDMGNEDDYFLGEKDGTMYYFIYEKDHLTTLDFDSLALIKTKGEQYIIYADNCLLSKEFMAMNNIIFKKIPRDITRF